MKSTIENRKAVKSIIKNRGHEQYGNLAWQTEDVAYWFFMQIDNEIYKGCQIISYDEIDMFIKKSKRKQKLNKLNHNTIFKNK